MYLYFRSLGRQPIVRAGQFGDVVLAWAHSFGQHPKPSIRKPFTFPPSRILQSPRPCPNPLGICEATSPLPVAVPAPLASTELHVHRVSGAPGASSFLGFGVLRF